MTACARPRTRNCSMPKKTAVGKHLNSIFNEWKTLNGDLKKRKQEHVDFVLNLARRATSKTKLGEGIADHGNIVDVRLGLSDDPRFPDQPSFRVVFKDDYSCSVSQGNLESYARNPDTAHVQDRKRHMRELVERQILLFRDTTDAVCMKCKRPLDVCSGDVDHIEGYEFSKLLALFDKAVAAGELGNSDESWVRFHEKHAKLQRLCKPCHGEKTEAARKRARTGAVALR